MGYYAIFSSLVGENLSSQSHTASKFWSSISNLILYLHLYHPEIMHSRIIFLDKLYNENLS
jgi:hypothetical protein